MTTYSHSTHLTHPTHYDLPGFLRLSSEIRDRIYRLVGTYNQSFFSSGLSMQDPFDLCGPYGLCEPYRRHTSPRIPPVGFYGLLLTCRTIYSETSALLYSSNQFFCHYEALHSLSPLRDLRAKSVASLTSLKIILNQASCHSRDAVGRGRGGCCTEPRLFEIYYGIRDLKCDQDCRYSGHSDGGERHDPPLRRSHPSTKPMLAEWYKTAAYLGRHITPGRLELSFVCDIHSRDTELAIMVLDAFRHFPPLKNCHIRLSKTPNSMLRNLARNAVLRCRSLQPSLSLPPLRRPVSPVSGLAGLPRELRLHILEYTDLVTPLKEVLWTVSPGKYVACQPSCPSWVGRGNHDWEPGIHHGCQFNHCSERPYWDTANYVGCYCQLTHAAASSTCRCWAPPTSLFLVSRAMRHDASSVFFSQNRFAVVDSPQLNMFGPSRQSGFDQTRRLAVSRFLRDVVPVDCLGYLRFVEMVFPPYIGGQWPLKGDAVYKEWAETIAQVKDKLNLPALTIRMVAAFHLGEEDDSIAPLTEAEAKQVLEGYFHVMRPLTRLGGYGGLAGFYARLTWPWRRTEATREKIWGPGWDLERGIRDWMVGRESWLKEQAERFVLGGRYHHARSKAKEPRESAWESIFVRNS